MKKIEKINKKILIIIIIVIICLGGYYIYYKNSNTYKEFENISQIEELLPYEEEHQNTNSNTNFNDTSTEISHEEEMIMVHITGEVKNWGVIELKSGSRIIDAVNEAGGFTEDADTEKINLAYIISDGMKIYIPNKNEDINDDGAEYISTDSGENIITGGKKLKENENKLININKATQTELESLPGIGPSTALKIISYRNEQGNFSSIEDIKNVNGIGESKFENIKDLICIK